MQESADYSTSRVPSSATYSGWHIALVIVGGTIAIPAFLMAATLGATLGLRDAAIAFASGCLALGSLAALTGLCGQRSRLSAYVLSEFSFGRWGGKIANVAIASSLIGWFGVTSAMFGRTADMLVSLAFGVDWPMEIFVVAGSALIVGVTLSGFKGIDKLALALVPVMLVFLGIAAWLSIEDVEDWSAPQGGSNPMTLATAISAVIGSYIAGVAIQPDYSRFARTKVAALSSAFLALGVSFPLVLFLTAIPAVAMNEPDVLNVLVQLGVGGFACLLLLLAAWSSNVLSLYSGSLSLATCFRRVQLKSIIVVFGVAGTALALTRVDQHLVEYLILLGITIPPIASIYAVETLLFRSRFDEEARQQQPPFAVHALSAWVVAIVLGYLAHKQVFTLTTVAAIDSILVAAGLSALWHPLGPLRRSQD